MQLELEATVEGQRELHLAPLGRSLAARPSLIFAALSLALVLGVVAAVYAPTLHQSFHGDDYVAFTEFRSKDFGTYVGDVLHFKDASFYWRPLGKIFHYALYDSFGFDPYAFRLAALLIFLATLAAIYAFCRGERLGHWTALAAAAAMGLMPNHVVSVTWVTNTSRLQAALFIMLGLVLLQRARNSRHAFAWEALALLVFVGAPLSDETAIALAPLPFLYASFVRDERVDWRGALVRAAVYGALAAAVIPPQFANTLNDEPRLTLYGLGPHVVTQAWVLASQLVLPLASAKPIDVMLASVPPEQWGAGLAAIVAAIVLLIAGSRLVRFLVIWAALALAPFTLWNLPYTTPRYVYLAAIPFAILLAWIAVKLVSLVVELTSRPAVAPRALRLAAAGAGLVAVVLLFQLSSGTTRARNAVWGNETAKYGVLARQLEKEVPELPSGSRVVVFYADWPQFWASSTARSVYGDRSIVVVGIPHERIERPPIIVGPKDVVFYLMGERLMPSLLTR